MNSLSWFLYFTDVSQNIALLMLLTGIGLGGVSGACLLAYAAEDWEPGPAKAKLFLYGAAPLLVFCCLIPGKETMYAIAASQVGERIVKSEQVQGIANDATKALQSWIKKQIEPEAKK